MITIPTVFVFGAGVSHPFQFPLGFGLRNRIIDNLDPSNEFYMELRNVGFPRGEITAFREALRDSGKESVDAFLEHRTDYINVGKAAIAQELTRHEAHSVLFHSQGENLYFYLYKHLNATPEEFTNNQLTIITYNYDRSFEHFLFTALRNSYRLADEQTAELMRYIPIIHLHGHLGLLPWQGEGGRNYGSGDRLEDVSIASKNIKIIHEQIDVDEDPEFQRAHHYLSNTSRLIFLGFGYDRTNLLRLRLPKESTQLQVFGSCYGMTESETTNLKFKFFRGHATLGRSEYDALNFLRHSVSLS